MAIALSDYPTLLNDANLVHYWKLENTSDSQGTITLTNNGTTPFNNAKFTKGADFGTVNPNKYLNYTSLSALTYAQYAAGWTYNFWYSFSNTAGNQNGTAGDYGFMGFYWIRVTNGTSIRQGGLKYEHASSRYSMDWFPNASNAQSEAYGTTASSLGTYSMVTVTYNGTTQIMYLNAGSIMAQNVTFGAYTLNDKQFFMGGLNAGGTCGINGTIDDFSIFSRALTPTEISDYYNSAPAVVISPSSSKSYPMLMPGFII